MAELLALADDECRELWRDLKLGYTESPGLPLLRAEVARLYESVAADDVLMFAGAEEAIFVTLNTLLAPGDHAIVTWPAYQSLHEVGRGTGAAVESLPLEERHRWELDLDALRARVRPETRLIVVNFPHNPTGALIDRERFEAVVALARERPGVFVAWTHDIAWIDAVYGSQRHRGVPWDLFTSAAPGVRYVAITHERARQLSEVSGLPSERICVVPNGIDLTGVLGLSPTGIRLASRFDLTSADPLLLLPARITRRKRIEAAIDATRALRERGRDAALVVTGPPGPHSRGNRAYVAELVARAKGIARVHLLYPLGIRAHFRLVADLYALADALVLPSANEGFGLPLLEAALYRLPIVCSDLPTLRETAGEAATYVPRDASGETIADAIEATLATPLEGLRERAHTLAWPRVIKERVAPVVLEGFS
jgi:glycosyltransferase involved in cell wall biosynthesis